MLLATHTGTLIFSGFLGENRVRRTNGRYGGSSNILRVLVPGVFVTEKRLRRFDWTRADVLESIPAVRSALQSRFSAQTSVGLEILSRNAPPLGKPACAMRRHTPAKWISDPFYVQRQSTPLPVGFDENHVPKIHFVIFTGFKSRHGYGSFGSFTWRFPEGPSVENATNGRTLLKWQRIWPYWKVWTRRPALVTCRV